MAVQVSAPYNYDTLLDDLLTRIASIQATIPGIKFAEKHWWDPTDQPFPFFRNRLVNNQIDRQQGRPIHWDRMVINMLLFGGSISAGYTHEQEDRLNQSYYAVITRFSQVPHLNDPVSGAAFQYILPGKKSRILQTQGIMQQTITVKAGSPVIYLVQSFPLEVNLDLPIPGMVS